MFKIYGGATKFTQWTKDQKLIMSELPIGADVMFYNDPNEDEPTITEVYEIRDEEGNAIRVCDVPNIFLTETKRIKVRIPKRVRGLYGTMHSIAGQNEKYFEIEPAEKPADYVYEKTVTNTIDPKRLPDGYPYDTRKFVHLAAWDKDVTSDVTVNIMGMEFIRVSDKVLAVDELDGAVIVGADESTIEVEAQEMSGIIPIAPVEENSVSGLYCCLEDNTSFAGYTFPKAGIYTMSKEACATLGVVQAVSISRVSGELVKMVDKFVNMPKVYTFNVSAYENVDDATFYAILRAYKAEDGPVFVKFLDRDEILIASDISSGKIISFAAMPVIGEFGTDMLAQQFSMYQLERGGRLTHKTLQLYSGDGIYLASSSGNGKIFKITVDDSGSLTATETGTI